MFFADEEQAIRSRFKTLWEAAYPSVLIQYDGVEFVPVADTAYVALSIMNGAGNQISMNDDPVRRFVGVIQVAVKIPARGGVKLARQYADVISGIFDRAQFSYNLSGAIVCYTPSIAPPQVSTDWVTVIVSVSYKRDVQRGGSPSTQGTAPLLPGKTHRYALTGAINNVNTVFTLPVAPDPTTLQIFQNFILVPTTSYVLVGSTVTFNVAPSLIGGVPDVLEAFA